MRGSCGALAARLAEYSGLAKVERAAECCRRPEPEGRQDEITRGGARHRGNFAVRLRISSRALDFLSSTHIFDRCGGLPAGDGDSGAGFWGNARIGGAAAWAIGE